MVQAGSDPYTGSTKSCGNLRTSDWEFLRWPWMKNSKLYSKLSRHNWFNLHSLFVVLFPVVVKHMFEVVIAKLQKHFVGKDDLPLHPELDVACLLQDRTESVGFLVWDNYNQNFTLSLKLGLSFSAKAGCFSWGWAGFSIIGQSNEAKTSSIELNLVRTGSGIKCPFAKPQK